jgi:Fic family protein
LPIWQAYRWSAIPIILAVRRLKARLIRDAPKAAAAYLLSAAVKPLGLGVDNKHVANGWNIGIMILPPTLPISALSVSLIAQIHEHKGALRAMNNLSPARLLALRQVATMESVAAGVRLGSVVLSDGEVRHVLGMLKYRMGAQEALKPAAEPVAELDDDTDAELLDTLVPAEMTAGIDDFSAEPLADYEIEALLVSQAGQVRVFNADEEQAAGYYEALNCVLGLVPSHKLTEENLHELHRTLLKHSKKDVWHAGKYKASANHRSFNNPDTGARSQLPGANPLEAPAKLKNLLQWLQGEREHPTQHPLLTIAAFIAGFHAIRPYQDGNARMGLLLTRLLLLQSGYSQVAYASLEAQLERDRDAFYTALDRTLAGIYNPNPHWEPWTAFFLSSLVDHARRLFSRLERDKEIFSALPKLSSDIVNLAREHGRVTMADAIRLTGSNRNTLKLHFRKLVHEGRLLRHGMGAGVWYQPR